MKKRNLQNMKEKFAWKSTMKRIRGDILNRKAFEIDCQRNSFAGTPAIHTHALTELKKEKKKKERNNAQVRVNHVKIKPRRTNSVIFSCPTT